MDKVFIVYGCWSYDGCPDDYANVDVRDIKRIVDSEEKAIICIQDALRPMVEFRKAVLTAKEKVDKSECRREKCSDCIACKDTIDLNEVPTYEYIKEHNEDEYGILYAEDHDAKSFYQYEEHEVF